MNTNYPHEIVPERELTPETKKDYVPLSEGQAEMLRGKTPAQRAKWLMIHRPRQVREWLTQALEKGEMPVAKL